MKIASKPGASFLKGQITELLQKKNSPETVHGIVPATYLFYTYRRRRPAQEGAPHISRQCTALGAALDRVDAAYVAQQAQVAGNSQNRGASSSNNQTSSSSLRFEGNFRLKEKKQKLSFA